MNREVTDLERNEVYRYLKINEVNGINHNINTKMKPKIL